MHKDYGKFCWYELMTTDVPAAERFYSSVVGWTTRDSGMEGMNYTLAYAGENQAAGIMEIPAEAEGMPPAWVGYVFTDDIEKTAKDIVSNGGQVHREPDDIPGIGRFAVVADSDGAVFSLFSSDESPFTPPFMAPGHVGWSELMAGSLEKVWPFYASTFGWTKDTTIDMSEGGMGAYQLFSVRGGDAVGGMMTKPAEVPAPPHWGFYFVVEGLDAAGKRVTDGGGQIINGPMEVPGGAWIINCFDPQGAYFSLVAANR